ncbi:universal stress protein [Nocardioides jensenii]|uniref:universal stress protein n=1 Tax=Nocardioides jensenii TaxID=1843 RepID=UPI00082F8E74|nr:universal stress protein [Nocardioides jensenii]
MNETPNRIVAAVAGDDSTALLQFAAQEAVSTHSELHLVHVMRMPPDLPASFDEARGAARAFGELILDRAKSAVLELVGEGAAVTQELVEDSRGVVHDIIARSDGARLVVLQHRHLTGLHRFTSMSTTQGVASRADAPVVSVPESWRSTQEQHHRTTVAVNDPAGAERVLRTAFALADRRQDELRVVHAWWLSNGYDDVVVGDDARADWDRRLRAEFAPHLEELQARHPDVRVELQVRHASVGRALLDASRESDLVVMGRRHPYLPIGSHLGPLVRTVLRASEVPVVLVENAKHTRTAMPRSVDLVPPFY